MKASLPALLLCIGFPLFLQAQWVRQYPVAKLEQVLDIAVHNDGYGYAVGSDDLIMKLNGESKTWNIQLSWDQNWKLEVVDYLAGSNGMIAVAGGPGITMTTNGGASWAQLTGPATGIHAIKIFSATDLMVIASNGVYRWRNDSWENYSPVTSGIIGGFILDDQHLWAFTGGASAVIHYTSNGGQNWNQNSDIERPDLVKFYNSAYGVATDGRTVFKSLNGGQSWTVTSDNIISNTSADLTFGESGHILFAALINGNATMSQDSGLTWTLLPTGSGTSRSFSIDATSDTEFWVGNELSSVSYTTDGGSSFIETSGPPRGTILDMVFPNRDDNRLTGFAVGLKGLVMRTLDGGEHWEDISSGDTRNYLAIDGNSEGDLWIGSNQRILHSTDLGETWQEKVVFIGGNINDIVQSREDYLLAVSSTGIIYRSPDHGESWDTVYQTNVQLKSVTPTGQDTYIVTGFDGMILRSIDKGVSWQVVPPPVAGLQYEQSHFLAPDHLWVVSSSFTRQMWFSNDLGQSWDTLELPIDRFWDGVFFISPDTGAVVGHTNVDSRIYMTFSGGTNWESTYNVPIALQGISGRAHPNGSMWIYGAGSDIERIQFCTDTAKIDLIQAITSKVCEGSELMMAGSGTYDDLYNWNFPSGWTIVDGERNDTITFLLNATSGVVTASAENACGESAPASLPVTVEKLPVTFAISGSPVICKGQFSEYIAGAENADAYYWIIPQGWLVSGDTNSNTIQIQPTTSNGVLYVYSENECGISDTASISVELFELPGDIHIEVTGDTLTVPGVFDFYQWLLNGTPIPGAIGSEYIISQSGSYSVQVSVIGCIDTLGPEQVIFSSAHGIKPQHALSLQPNPAMDVIHLDGISDGINYVISNHLGVKVAEGKVESMQVNVAVLPAGVYVLTVQMEGGVGVGRFCKVK